MDGNILLVGVSGKVAKLEHGNFGKLSLTPDHYTGKIRFVNWKVDGRQKAVSGGIVDVRLPTWVRRWIADA